MPIDFPNSPLENDTYATAGKTWIYVSGKWQVVGATPNLGNDSITTDMIQDAAITSVKLAPGAAGGGGLDTTAEGAVIVMDIGA